MERVLLSYRGVVYVETLLASQRTVNITTFLFLRLWSGTHTKPLIPRCKLWISLRSELRC